MEVVVSSGNDDDVVDSGGTVDVGNTVTGGAVGFAADGFAVGAGDGTVLELGPVVDVELDGTVATLVVVVVVDGGGSPMTTVDR